MNGLAQSWWLYRLGNTFVVRAWLPPRFHGGISGSTPVNVNVRGEVDKPLPKNRQAAADDDTELFHYGPDAHIDIVPYHSSQHAASYVSFGLPGRLELKSSLTAGVMCGVEQHHIPKPDDGGHAGSRGESEDDGDGQPLARRHVKLEDLRYGQDDQDHVPGDGQRAPCVGDGGDVETAALDVLVPDGLEWLALEENEEENRDGVGGERHDASVAGQPHPSRDAEYANVEKQDGQLGEVLHPAIEELRGPKCLSKLDGMVVSISASGVCSLSAPALGRTHSPQSSLVLRVLGPVVTASPDLGQVQAVSSGGKE